MGGAKKLRGGKNETAKITGRIRTKVGWGKWNEGERGNEREKICHLAKWKKTEYRGRKFRLGGGTMSPRKGEKKRKRPVANGNQEIDNEQRCENCNRDFERGRGGTDYI